MFPLLPFRERPYLSHVMVWLFAVLFAWISVGFWSSLAGFLMLLSRRDRFRVTRGLPGAGESLKMPEGFMTAILFPVYNEDPHKVMAGIATVRDALRGAGTLGRFDVFVLSDTTDPDLSVLEEETFHEALAEEGAAPPGQGPGGGLFYRRRQANLKRKSGNIADFCRRWGALYRYMVVFDADSLMSADCLARIVLAMEARPDVGIIQTPPKAIFSKTPLSMTQQFANHLYGGIFAAGLQFWQLGDAQYWGHNAIIRTAPFMEHCQLGRLKGKSPLSGDILSHDFVESALMRKGGYGVWLAYDLDGSWEMTPPTLTDELARDRRWCQGNLQHLRLLFTKGFFPTHRALFLNGAMSYGSALLWLMFLLASTAEALLALLAGPVYFPEGPSLFTDWPRYFPGWALALLSSTALLLFFPKLLSVLYACLRTGCAGFGGFFAMSFGVLLEIVVSTLLAPVRMMFHSYFVVMTLLGVKVGWNPQNRAPGAGLSWGQGLRVYWVPTFAGVFWGLSMFVLSPGFFYWLSPVAAGLALSVPIAVLTSREGLGRALGRLGLLRTPPDTMPAPEISELEARFQEVPSEGPSRIPRANGFARAVVLPQVLSVHLLASVHDRRNFPEKEARLEAAVRKALKEGPDSLSRKEKRLLLSDRGSLVRLHKAVWELPREESRLWGDF
jgi:membrane glycosyltransferase